MRTLRLGSPPPPPPSAAPDIAGARRPAAAPPPRRPRLLLLVFELRDQIFEARRPGPREVSKEQRGMKVRGWFGGPLVRVRERGFCLERAEGEREREGLSFLFP